MSESNGSPRTGVNGKLIKDIGEGGVLAVILYFLWEINQRLSEIAGKLDWVFQWMAQQG